MEGIPYTTIVPELPVPRKAKYSSRPPRGINVFVAARTSSSLRPRSFFTSFSVCCAFVLSGRIPNIKNTKPNTRTFFVNNIIKLRFGLEFFIGFWLCFQKRSTKYRQKCLIIKIFLRYCHPQVLFIMMPNNNINNTSLSYFHLQN